MSSPAGVSPPAATSKQRLFFALMPAAAEQQALMRAVSEALPQNQRWTALMNLHVTLVFLGDIDAERRQCVEQVADHIRLPAFELSLEQLGYWPRRHMLWAMPTTMPEALRALVTDLQQGLTACQFEPEARAFRAHVTLSRHWTKVPPISRFPAVTWPVRQFALVESVALADGVRYQAIRFWPLED